MTTVTSLPVRDAPTVSCLVVSYNQARWVEDALRSVASQDYPNREFIVIDDASVDNSQAIISRWITTSGCDVKFVQHSTNQGIVRTLNEAIELATGDYVAMLAADDMWLAGKLERQVGILEQLPPDVAMVYSHSRLVGQDGRSLGVLYLQQPGYDWLSIESPPQGKILEDLLYHGNFIQLQSGLIRREALGAVGPGNGALFFEDYELLLKLASRYEIAFSDVPSVLYRLSGPSSAIRRFYPRILENQYDVRVKYLRRNGSVDAKLAALLAAEARLMYRHRTPHHIRYLRDARRYEQSKAMHWLTTAATLRIPWAASWFVVKFGRAILHPRV